MLCPFESAATQDSWFAVYQLIVQTLRKVTGSYNIAYYAHYHSRAMTAGRHIFRELLRGSSFGAISTEQKNP